MSETPRIAVLPESPGALDPPFLGSGAPPLEGEEPCICGALEGEHLSDHSCPATGCEYFVAESDFDEQTRPDVHVEYEPGCEPATGVR